MLKSMPPSPHTSPRRSRSPLAIVLPLLVLTATFLWDAGPPSFAQGLGSPGAADRETAHFARCAGSERITCVVDGDTFWYRGEKIRISDINTPETSRPACDREAELGEAATERMTELLNEGPFTLVEGDDGRNRDRYGRLLREVTRNGESLGGALEAEGLAQHWQGRRGDWCGV